MNCAWIGTCARMLNDSRISVLDIVVKETLLWRIKASIVLLVAHGRPIRLHDWKFNNSLFAFHGERNSRLRRLQFHSNSGLTQHFSMESNNLWTSCWSNRPARQGKRKQKSLTSYSQRAYKDIVFSRRVFNSPQKPYLINIKWHTYKEHTYLRKTRL